MRRLWKMQVWDASRMHSLRSCDHSSSCCPTIIHVCRTVTGKFRGTIVNTRLAMELARHAHGYLSVPNFTTFVCSPVSGTHTHIQVARYPWTHNHQIPPSTNSTNHCSRTSIDQISMHAIPQFAATFKLRSPLKMATTCSPCTGL